ncbi:cyanophycinase [Hydrogenophaga sp. OTU3427]|uniref:cyanophycinase n=1 Tax=Hydrogenophaga sp. OTU3427 TaxID=3043856 RepID=UPI00313D56D9
MFKRRELMLRGAALGLLPLHARAQALAATRRVGRLVAIGGAEDRLQDRVILRRYVELCGGPRARIRVLSAASGDPRGVWLAYQQVFAELGVSDSAHLDIIDPTHANSAEVVDQILDADGIFISGGDQRRLMDLVWETEAFRALHTAFHLRGCCVGGTSAGAAVLSRHMLAQGAAPRLPEKEAAELDLGLGFVSKAIIDQHFSERGRLGRLLSVLAQRPDMLGVGIDEDTALVIERGLSVEVVGQGAVTLVDGRQLRSNFDDIDSHERLEMLNVRVHLLPAGRRYSASSGDYSFRRMPPSLRDAVSLLVAPGPIRG